MYETDEDVAALQDLLDASYARANEHLRGIWGPETRLDARELSEELAGIQVLDLATVTSRGEPRVAPVDAFFPRGKFWLASRLSGRGLRRGDQRPRVHAHARPLVLNHLERRAGIRDLPERRRMHLVGDQQAAALAPAQVHREPAGLPRDALDQPVRTFDL